MYKCLITRYAKRSLKNTNKDNKSKNKLFSGKNKNLPLNFILYFKRGMEEVNTVKTVSEF